MKKLICLILLVTCFNGTSLISYADSCTRHWFIKRRGCECPEFPPDADEIEKYDAYYVDKSGEKKIYLTFDAGYENGHIKRILDVLKEKEVPAAFFLLDNIILKNTDLVIRMADEGHLVCNHTKNHKNLSGASFDEISRNLSALEMIYEEKCGRTMAKYFRFPEGSYSIEAIESIQKLGYKTIFWSFAYDDWDNERQPDREKAIKKILDNTHSGAVMLFHPTSETNAAIMAELIDAWREMGYSFGTLDELTKAK